MKYSKHFFICFLFILQYCYAQTSVDLKFLNKIWDAQWITHPSAGLKKYEIYHFRKTFHLDDIPEHFIVHLSADSRYKFYVNGKMAGLGPARSDLAHWYFDSYDLASYLQKGNNVIAALV